MKSAEFEIVDLVTFTLTRSICEVVRAMKELADYGICEVCHGGLPFEDDPEGDRLDPEDVGRFIVGTIEVRRGGEFPYTCSHPICNRCCGDGFPVEAVKKAVWRRYECGWQIERDGCEVVQLRTDAPPSPRPRH